MPNRILRDWTDSYRIESLTAAGERMFVRLIMKADDHGRFHADPRLVKAACFPLLAIPDAIVGRWLEELDGAGLIHRYTFGGRNYLAIRGFDQRLRAKRAKFPAPDGQADDWCPANDGHVTVMCQSCDGHVSVNGRPESESESESETKSLYPSPATPAASTRPVASKAFEAFWTAYPRKVGKGAARRAWASRKLDGKLAEILEAIVRQKGSEQWRDDGGRFIPHPATWLNQERWEDSGIDRAALRPPQPMSSEPRKTQASMLRDCIAKIRQARETEMTPGDAECAIDAARDAYGREIVAEALSVLHHEGELARKAVAQ